MSGDVQPRRRKDKKKKRDSLDRKSEGDIFDNKKEEDDVKESHHGVHAAKMGADDVLLHVQDEHVTGGHWCAKILFFSLLAILLGLIGLIIMENRGLADLDTPLSKSRYSEYFEGWVDEHRQSHNEHNKITDELEGNYNEVFKEEEDEDENDDDDDHDHEDDGIEKHHDDHEDENVEHDDDHDDNDENSENEEEKVIENDDDDDDQENVEETDGEEMRGTEEDEESDLPSNKNEENDDVDDDDNEEEDEVYSKNQNNNDYDKENENQNDDQNDVDNDDNENNDQLNKNSEDNKYDFANGNDPFDEIEDDANDEEIVDNDKEEFEHFERQVKEQDEINNANDEQQNDEEEYSSSLAVKFIVGLALAFVAHLVLIKKRDNKTDDSSETIEEILMKRRLTIATHEEQIFQNENEQIDDIEQYLDDADSEDEELENHNKQKILYNSKMINDEINEIYFKSKNIINLKNENEEQKFNKLKFNDDEIDKTDVNLLKKLDNYSRETDQNKEYQLSCIKESSINDKIETKSNERTATYNIKQKIFSINEQNLIKDEPNKNVNEMKQESFEKEEAIEDEKGEEDEDKEEIEIEEGAGDDDDEEVEEDEEEEDDEEDEEEEDEDEEEIEEDIEFDVEDADLMRRLDEKYGKLPTYDSEEDDEDDIDDKSWTKIKSKRDDRQQNNNNNNNNYDYASLNDQLRRAKKEESQNNLKISLDIYESILLKYPNNPEALYGKAKILDKLSDIYQNNHILNDAIEAYKKFLVTVNNKSIIPATGYTKKTTNTATTVTVDNVTFKEAAERCIDRMRFRGLHLNAVPVHQMLIKRFNDDPYYRNQLAVTYLLVNRLTDAKNVLNETLKRWPNDGFAQVHYGFVLKNLDNNLEEAIKYLQSGIKTNDNGTKDGRFYFHLGDALQRLNRNDEAKLIYKKGAELKLFLSEYQRSLYNVNDLKGKPFWTKKETSYQIYFEILERNWEKIRDEGLNILNSKGLFVNESENLKDTGDWKQYELFTRGSKNVKNCKKVPFTCKLIEVFPMARYCKRGQTKFSVIHPGTHVWPHCGPTNCRLRAHLGLKIPSGTKIRVANEERTWKEGKFLIFDDSFEHEVWHNGTSIRLVLIVDVWHPELTDEQKQTLSLI